jgi:peptidoglycan biosynthesis protein MviN/MurJ (putative lipid II flippase)
MIGRSYWILIWYGILAIGVIGLVAAVYWGRKTQWKNLDEVLRAVGTVTVSLGMVLLLRRSTGGIAQALLIASLFSFVLAFVLGRRVEADRPPSEETEDDQE